MKKGAIFMAKKILAILLAVLMMVCITGCTAPKEVWVSEEVVLKGDSDSTDRTKKTTTGDSKQTTAQQGVATRPSKEDKDLLKFALVNLLRS